MNTNNNNAQTQDVNGILVEVKSKVFDRKWGWLEAWDVYADGIHVARVSGGHYDCTARRSATSHYDEDGKMWFTHDNNNDFRLPFRMTDELRNLILAKQPCLLWQVVACGCPQNKGFFATEAEARQHCSNRFEQAEERTATI